MTRTNHKSPANGSLTVPHDKSFLSKVRMKMNGRSEVGKRKYHRSNTLLVPRICFAEEVLKEYRSIRGSPGLRVSGWGAEKPVKPVFIQWLSQSYAPPSGRNGNNSRNLKRGARSAIFIELLNMTHDETKVAARYYKRKARSALRFFSKLMIILFFRVFPWKWPKKEFFFSNF